MDRWRGGEGEGGRDREGGKEGVRVSEGQGNEKRD